MENALLICKAAIEDAEKLCCYVTALKEERFYVTFNYLVVPSVEDEKHFIQKLMGSENSVMLIAHHEDEVVGIINFNGYVHPQRYHAGEMALSVAKPHRNKGVGRKLIAALFQWIKTKQQIKRVELEVFANNFAAIHLYESTGFLHEGRRVKAAFVENEPVDILIMARPSDEA